jgi:hypothetical protein
VENENEREPKEILKLDGSYGTGETALLTIITKNEVEGDCEETYQFPYGLIDFDGLNKHMHLKLIAGFRIERQFRQPTVSA